MTMTSSNGWRTVIAVLANSDTRHAMARMMLGDDLTSATHELAPSKRRKVMRSMQRSGLVGADGLIVGGVFRALLEESPVVRSEGIGRFLDEKRIQQYPANLEERGRLLAWVARDAFRADEVLDEQAVNERLAPYHDDVAVLRRYLVDYQLVERRADGTEYALTGEDPVVTID